MKPCVATTAPRWARRKDARPQELLDAALEEFCEKGFAGSRLEDVAKRAGVSKGTVYLYFQNKEELLKAVVTEHVVPIVHEAKSLDTSNKCASDVIRQAILLWWDRYGSTKLSAITKIILGEANSFPDIGQFFHEQVIQPWWDYLESVLRRGQNSGEFVEIDFEYTAKVLCAPLVTLGIWKRTMDQCCQTETDAQRYLDAHIGLVLKGLKNNNIPTTTGHHGRQHPPQPGPRSD